MPNQHPECNVSGDPFAHMIFPQAVASWAECYAGKDSGQLCLQIILLFEADCNFKNKWMGQAAISQAERLSLVVDEQYGSHWLKDTITQCLNKRLWYNYICFSHELVALLCSNNAKSCYDCIVLLVAALCLCQWGAALPAVFSMINKISGMNHHIWMVFGTPNKVPFATLGASQLPVSEGNGAGPQIWAVSSTLFEIMCTDGFLC